MLEYPNPVKVTSNSLQAIAYRNINRDKVDRIFLSASKKETAIRYDDKVSQKTLDEIEQTKSRAKQLWRKIITESNLM